jgi:hypothetical protein
VSDPDGIRDHEFCAHRPVALQIQRIDGFADAAVLAARTVLRQLAGLRDPDDDERTQPLDALAHLSAVDAMTY